MPSRLRQQVSFDDTAPAVSATSSSFSKSAPPQKKQKMTITQTYYLAHTARGKLSTEASRGDHDLRILVGHANLLDSLMVELQDAEREQEAWFNSNVNKAATKVEKTGRVQWQDTIYEEAVEVPDGSDSESDSDYDEREPEPVVPLRRLHSPPVTTPLYDDEGEEGYEDEDEDNLDLALVRTQSYSAEREPELVNDSDDSDDESPPNSPPSTPAPFLSQRITGRNFAKAKASSQLTRIAPTEFSPSELEQSNAPIIAVC